MASRAIQGTGSVFQFLNTPISTFLANGSAVIFPKIVAEIHHPHPDDRPGEPINRITYYETTHKFHIITTPTTENNFFIMWEISISSCYGNRLPTFAIVAETADGTEVISLPNSGCRMTDTLCGSCLLNLPTPSLEVGRVDYYLSLMNRSGADCYYSMNSIYITGIIITSIDCL